VAESLTMTAERVMGAYQEAFDSQHQLRVEFRAQGMPNPWRLLLLMPLGDENLQHVSLREHGGFGKYTTWSNFAALR